MAEGGRKSKEESMTEEMEPCFAEFVRCIDVICKEYDVEMTYIAHTKPLYIPTLFGIPIFGSGEKINVVRKVTSNFDSSVLNIWKDKKDV